MRSLFAFNLIFYVADCKQFRSDYRFQPETNGWLKQHRIPATFHDAWLRCYLEGAVLASPSNIFIESAMRREMRNGNVSTSGVFTGIHATFSKGDFFSVEGTPLNNMQLQWTPLEPDNKNNEEDCILFLANGTIADISCYEIYPYFCFKEYGQNMSVTGCGTVDKGIEISIKYIGEYNFDTRTGKCYKFHRNAQNWKRAFMTCAAEGGYLAVINSETEAEVLQELFAKNPKETIKNTLLYSSAKNLILIGIHDLEKEGIWTTIHGTSLADAGYDIWSSGQPDNKNSVEYCGGMYRNGRLNDINCYLKGPFICEKSSESLRDDGDKELSSWPQV